MAIARPAGSSCIRAKLQLTLPDPFSSPPYRESETKNQPPPVVDLWASRRRWTSGCTGRSQRPRRRTLVFSSLGGAPTPPHLRQPLKLPRKRRIPDHVSYLPGLPLLR